MTTLKNVTQIVDVTHLVRPPSELEQARAHLREAQELLRCARCDPEGITAGLWKLPPDAARNAERQVLAALSWVWDIQQRLGLGRA